VRKAAPPPIVLKTIIEATVLDRDQLLDATIVSCVAGADFVKTSTGWNGGASTQDVTLMRIAADMCGRNSKIKASGGLRSAEDVVKMLKAGAHRIGTSNGVKIMAEMNEGEILEQGASHAVS
jgi:deoxyribose-phosphate aldolase